MMKAANKAALITGATGFVGSYLVEKLISQGWIPHLIIRPESDLSPIQHLVKKVILHIHDGSTKEMVNIVQRANPEIVIHLASRFIVEHKSEDIEILIKSNILFGVQLIEAMVVNKIYRLINVGTSWQNYENKEYNPVCLYAGTKEAFEKILIFYLESTPLKCITFKLFDTYGPRDPRTKLFYLLKTAAATGVEIDMSPGEQMIDLVYIDDVIDAFLIGIKCLQNSNMKCENYAISSGTLITLKDLVAKFSKISGTEIKVHWGGRAYRKREVMIPWRNFQLIPGWEPKINLDEGIKRLLIDKRG